MRTQVHWFGILSLGLSLGLLPATGLGGSEAPSGQPTITLEGLSDLKPAELEQLFNQSPPGELPTGRVQGRVVRLATPFLRGPLRGLLNVLWRGKFFYPEEGTLHNIVLGHRTFKGKVYQEASWLDGKPAWIIDYRETSPSIEYIRDEFRIVAPGIYLGWTFNRNDRAFLLNFAIDSNPPPKQEEDPPPADREDVPESP